MLGHVHEVAASGEAGMLWVVWKVVTAGSVIYMGSQIGVFTEILVTYPRIKARARQSTVHRFCQGALPPAEVSADTINSGSGSGTRANLDDEFGNRVMPPSTYQGRPCSSHASIPHLARLQHWRAPDSVSTSLKSRLVDSDLRERVI